MRVGVLTGGGDCPGLNAVIRAVVRKGEVEHGDTFVGFRDGWKGLTENLTRPLDVERCRGILPKGGTILGTSRTNPYKVEGGVEAVTDTLKQNEIDALVAIGGEDTLGVASRLHAEHDAHVVGVPKTIDNDLSATDYTFGFDTAVQIATEAMDRLRTTGDSHARCMIAEVMGRHVGWIALHSGMAAGAHAILIPEQKTSIEQICAWAESARDRGRAPLICVAEGFKLDTMDDAHSERGLDAFGRPRLGGIGDQLAPEIEKRTGIETRATTLGHIQRGGTPTAYDRVLATRYGMAAIESIRSGHWGRMVALRGTQIVHVPFEDALGRLKVVPQTRYDEAAVLFG